MQPASVPDNVISAVRGLESKIGMGPELSVIAEYLSSFNNPEDCHFWKLMSESLEAETRGAKITIDQLRVQLKHFTDVVEITLKLIEELTNTSPTVERRKAILDVKEVIDATRKMIGT
jgi:hypothetical protein